MEQNIADALAPIDLGQVMLETKGITGDRNDVDGGQRNAMGICQD